MLLLLPLLVLSLAALLPVEANIRCYDCLSKSFPDCSDDSKMDSFDKIECQRDERLCSVLVMSDSSGNRVVSRQCSSSASESKQLKNYIRSVHGADLTVLKFEVCNTDLCNIQVTREQSPGSSTRIMAASSLSLLSLALGAVAALRLTI